MAGTNKNNASKFAYQDIREQILYLELAPGTALSEIDTAARYNISRTPVRDVFKALEAEGLLEIKPHIGTFVSLIDLDTVSDILYMREIMEQALFKDLSRNYDPSQAYQILLILQEQESIISSDMPIEEMSRKFILADNKFHHTLYEMSGRKNIAMFFNSINAQYERFRTFINRNGRDDLQRLYQDHMAIWHAIATQKYDILQDRITHHLYDGFHASSAEIHKHPEYFKLNNN